MTTKAEYWTNASIRALMQDEEGDPVHVITHETHKAIHLFAQGLVSGQLVASDQSCPGEAEGKAFRPAERPHRQREARYEYDGGVLHSAESLKAPRFLASVL